MSVLRHWLEVDEQPQCQHCPNQADERSFMCEDCAAQADEEVQTLRDRVESLERAVAQGAAALCQAGFDLEAESLRNAFAGGGFRWRTRHYASRLERWRGAGPAALRCGCRAGGCVGKTARAVHTTATRNHTRDARAEFDASARTATLAPWQLSTLVLPNSAYGGRQRTRSAYGSTGWTGESSASRSAASAPNAMRRSSSCAWPARTWYSKWKRSCRSCAALAARITSRRGVLAAIPELAAARAAGTRASSGVTCPRLAWLWLMTIRRGRSRASGGRARRCSSSTAALTAEVSRRYSRAMPDQSPGTEPC